MSSSGRVALLVFLLAGIPRVSSEQELGRLADKAPRDSAVVRKTLPDQVAKDMNRTDPVEVKAQVDTDENSGASFAMGPMKKPQGSVTMGPDSRFRFREGLFDPATGLLTKLDFEINWGRFRFAIVPPLKGSTRLGNLTGEVVIKTPTRSVHLLGTDVYITVDRNGATTVYVAEGSADVGEPGEAVRVEAGEWTTFGPGQPPQPPTRVDSDPTKRVFRGGAPEIPGPALLDIDSSRLDLPKARLP